MLHLHSSECRAALVAVVLTVLAVGVLMATHPLWAPFRQYAILSATMIVVVACRWTASGTRRRLPQIHLQRQRQAKFAVVTGASSGVGYEVALALAQGGWDLIITGRHLGRLEAAKQSIVRSTAGSRKAIVLAEVLEMSDRHAIASFCQRVAHLDIALLINNAAELNRHVVRASKLSNNGSNGNNVNGLERMMAANALGPMALTEGLLPTLHQTAQTLGMASRVVNVASCAHTICRGDVWDQVQGLSTLEDFTLLNFVYYYGLSKLCLIWYTLSLARRLEGGASGRQAATVSVVCCHPGIIGSGLYRSLLPWWLIRVLYWPSLLVGKTCREGANAVLRAALEPRTTMQCGYYLCDGDHGVGTNCPLLTPFATDTMLARRFTEWGMQCFDVEPAVLQ